MTKKNFFKKIKYYLRFMPDRLYIKLYYFFHMHKRCNLKNPKTYNEKINWLKLNDRREEYSCLVDKYEVKRIVSKIIGEQYIIPTLGIWNNVEEIDIEKLPNRFVLKCTHDSEGIVICTNRELFNWKEERKKLKKALKYNFYYIAREWPYKNVQPRIIAEEYLEDSQKKELWDYKFFCFDGEPKIMYIASDRLKHETKFDFYDMNFNHLNIKQHYPNANFKIEKPIAFEKMKVLAAKISKELNLKHIRVDFYEVDGKIYFGELTFYHMGGFMKFEPSIWDEKIGNLLKL